MGEEPNKLKEMFSKKLPTGSYPLNVIIFQKRGDGYKKFEDEADQKPETLGKQYWWLYDFEIEVQIPKEYIYEDNTVYLYNDGEEWTPFKFDFESLSEDGSMNVQAPDQDTKFWVSNKFKEADILHTTEPGWWDQHGQVVVSIVVPFVILLGTGIFFYLMNKSFGQTIQKFTQAANNLQGALEGSGF